MLNIFIGWDQREVAAWHTLAHSILTKASEPVNLIPVRQETLRQCGLYWREKDHLASTDFSLTRFLVPFLSKYDGYSVFLDCDILCQVDIAELFAMAAVLSKQPRPKGPRLTILTNAGGPGVLACDSLISHGGELTPLSPEAFKAYGDLLPAHWSRNNPVDILGDAEPERYAKALEIAAQDANSHGILVILTPQAMTDPTHTAEALKAYASLKGKPVLASWMGGADVAAGQAILNRANIPTFAYPDTAAKIFTDMWHYTYNLRGIYETPVLAATPEESTARRKVEAIVHHARESGRTLLTEHESKQVLAAYGIPTVETLVATTPDEAVAAAQTIDYPAAEDGVLHVVAESNLESQ